MLRPGPSTAAISDFVRSLPPCTTAWQLNCFTTRMHDFECSDCLPIAADCFWMAVRVWTKVSSTGRLSDDQLACGRTLGKCIARCIRSIFHHEDDMLVRETARPSCWTQRLCLRCAADEMHAIFVAFWKRCG